MNYLARVNPKFFAAIELFAAVGGTRHYLNGVFIEPHPEKGAILVASNGHRLAAFHDPDGWCKEPIIVGGITPDLVKACKGKKKGITIHKRLWISQGRAVVTANSTTEPPQEPFDAFVLCESRVSLIDAKYPDWRKAAQMTRADAIERFPAIDPKYLADLYKAAKIVDPQARGCGSSVRLEAQRDDNGMIAARLLNPCLIDRFFAVIMPLIDMERPESPLPSFVVATEPTPKAKPRVRHTPDGWVEIGARAAEGAPA